MDSEVHKMIVLNFQSREPPTSCIINGKVKEIPEMRVEFVIPNNLDACELKPYVSWRADVVNELPLTTETLFEMRYAGQIRQLHKDGKKLDDIIERL